MKLILGPKNYSSWSLRPWLLLRHAGLPFTEEVVPISAAASISPSGLVPCLVLPTGAAVWDSLAICEWAAEQPGMAGRVWPSDPAARAFARCMAAEMHSGFGDLRAALPMNCKFVVPAPGAPLAPKVAAHVARITALWREARERWGAPSGAGPYLFGAFSAADAMYAPVALRFRTYSVQVADPTAAAYQATVLADEHVRAWVAAGLEEGGDLVSTMYDEKAVEMGGVKVDGAKA